MKTLFLYIALVVLLIVISGTVKLVSVFQKSLFDGSNHFTVAVVKEGTVAEIVSFHPRIPSVSLAKIEGNKVPIADLGKTLAIAPDAVIQAKGNVPVGDDVTGTMMTAVWQFPTIRTDMTIVDVVRLSLLSKNISEDNKIVKIIKIPKQESDIDKIMSSFFSDETIASENVPIQIVNASNIPGMGKRLERVLTNLGANVIGVSTAATPVEKTKIAFAGEEETYTVKKLKSVLELPASQLRGESGADIVITVGKESKNTSNF